MSEPRWMMNSETGTVHRDFSPCVCAGPPDCRPVVVLDPENDADADRLAAAMRRNVWTGLDDAAPLDLMKAVLLDLAAPPVLKPAEPTGLGAVVEDVQGERWVRVEHLRADGCPWRIRYGTWQNWSGVDAVRVLSEGVTE